MAKRAALDREDLLIEARQRHALTAYSLLKPNLALDRRPILLPMQRASKEKSHVRVYSIACLSSDQQSVVRAHGIIAITSENKVRVSGHVPSAAPQSRSKNLERSPESRRAVRRGCLP